MTLPFCGHRPCGVATRRRVLPAHRGRYGDGAIGHHMSQGSGQGHPCAIPEEPNAKAHGTQWGHLDVQPVNKMDFARMRWALEHMVEKQSVNKMLGKVVVRAESVPSSGGFQKLHRVERDADIDAVVLAIYWNKPQDANAVHPWMSELRDLMFSAEPVGSGVEVAVDRFFRYEEEEKKRDFMGLSALRRAQELERLVQQGEAQRNGMCDAELAAHLLATKPSSIKNGAKIHVRDIWP